MFSCWYFYLVTKSHNREVLLDGDCVGYLMGVVLGVIIGKSVVKPEGGKVGC